MDEYQLIEIAKRFRLLEDAYERAEIYLVAEEERLRPRKEDGEQRAYKLNQYESGCAKEIDAERQLNQVQDVRKEMDSMFHCCRADLESMQESIRKLTCARNR